MSRAGRKRKAGQRQPNGQLARQHRPRVGEDAVVLSQPHRLGSTDQRCASALGRYVMAHNMLQEVYYAGEAYAGLVRRWRAAKGIPVSSRAVAIGKDAGPADATVDSWEREIERIEVAIAWPNEDGYKAMRRLILDDQDQPSIWNGCLSAALGQLAVEMMFLPASRHPYRGA